MDCERCEGAGTRTYLRYVEDDPWRAAERGVFGKTETVVSPCAWCGGCGVSPYTPVGVREREVAAKRAARESRQAR